MPVQRGGVECEQLDDEAVIYDRTHHSLHYLNSTAYLIWRNCTGETSVRQLLQEIADEFDGDKPPMDELAAALADLVSNGLVDWRRP